jgi:hypothetical protein
MNCPRCGLIVMGAAWTCLVHGDQRDIGNRAPAQESVHDQQVERTGRARARRLQGAKE